MHHRFQIIFIFLNSSNSHKKYCVVSKVGYGLRNQGSERLRDASGNMTSTPHGFYPNGSLKSLENKKYTYLEPTTRNSKSVGLGEAPDICVFTKLP